MFKKIAKYILDNYKVIKLEKYKLAQLKEKEDYIKNGSVPWTRGYNRFKEEYITKSINNQEFLKEIENKMPLNNYGFRLDERVIEYP